MIDTIEQIETPEGVTLSLRLAGLPVRTMAYLIDILIKTVIGIILGIICSIFGKGGLGILSVLAFLLQWFYPVYFEVFRNGQTPGKKRMKLRVLNDNGTPVSAQASIIRNFLRVADLLPGCYATGIISMILDSKLRRIGDLAGGTVVVYCEEPKIHLKTRLPKETIPENIPVDVTGEEKLAMIALAERHKMISSQRQQELAEILQPIHQSRGDKAVKTIHKYAASFLGD